MPSSACRPRCATAGRCRSAPRADDAAGPERTAELAFTVEEDYQRQGLASKLLQAATDIPRSRGSRRCAADVLAGNMAMRSVFERCGRPMRKAREDGVVHIVLQLGGPAAAAPAPA